MKEWESAEPCRERTLYLHPENLDIKPPKHAQTRRYTRYRWNLNEPWKPRLHTSVFSLCELPLASPAKEAYCPPFASTPWVHPPQRDHSGL